LSINNSDRIVGYVTTSNGVDHAFQYSGGVMTDIGTLGGDYSYAISINNSNVVVGGSYIDANNSVYHAFIYQTNSMTDLNGLLDASGSGWTLIEARSIDDSGQIVGVGRLLGADHGFLLNPILPGLIPRITGVTAQGANLLVSFTTVNSLQYVVESRTNLSVGVWSDAITGIVGNGGIVTGTNLGVATLTPRFYRVRVVGP
jgi:probable HAF family extracellular repeat protein